MTTPRYTLTPSQLTVADLAPRTLRSGSNYTLGGAAGTGKTTLVRTVVAALPRSRVAVCTPTGKAALVLRRKGVSDASTIHALMYHKVSDKPLTFERKDDIDVDFVICDEASMLSRAVYDDLMSYKKPVMFVGDPFQLEPVGDDARLMHQCDFVLTEVMRQALESPILRYATALRNGSDFDTSTYQCEPSTNGLLFADRSKRINFSLYDQILCGTNATRRRINERIRQRLKFTKPTPEADDKIVVLRNNYIHGLFNGMTLRVTKVIQRFPKSSDTIEAIDDIDGTLYAFSPWWKMFYEECDLSKCPRDAVPCDFGYALTCHKSQGSEWDSVAVIDEAFGNEPQRWRYTAATRASKHLTWIS